MTIYFFLGQKMTIEGKKLYMQQTCFAALSYTKIKWLTSIRKKSDFNKLKIIIYSFKY